MKKIFAIVLVYFSAITILSAQTAAKSAYVELFGPGIASVNFDTRFSKTEGGLGGRIGVGGFKSDEFGVFTLPVGLNYLIGKDNKNYFEMGAGFTYVHTKGDFLFGDDSDTENSSSFGHLSFGYRLQPANGGFLFRASIVPVFGKGYFVPYYAGLAFGYKF
jgi:hypothetical protein